MRGWLAILLAGGCGTPAPAPHQLPDPAAELRASLDADGDGCLTARELRGVDPGMVQRADGDGDGCLSSAELAVALP